MPAQFQTEFLFKRLSDFWNFFEDREDVKNVWDAYLRKGSALDSLLVQADLSKSLKSIPLFDRNDLEYFVFQKLVRRTNLETNKPFYVFEVDPAIFFIKNLNEKIDDLEVNRILSPPEFYSVTSGSGKDSGKTFLNFFRGVSPSMVGETFWTNKSDVVTGTGFTLKVKVGDIVQGQSGAFFKVIQVTSDTSIKVQGPTIFGKSLGTGNGAQVQFTLDTDTNVIDSSVEVFVDGISVLPAGFSVSIVGPNKVVTFVSAPGANKVITANYYRGYTGTTAFNRRTLRESIPVRLLSRSVYRDRRSVFKNFGTGIGLDRPTSFTYLNQVRGIYFARYNGPTISNMSLGSGILIDIPFAPGGEQTKVTRIAATIPKSVTVGPSFFPVQDPLNVAVVAGQTLPRDFNLITDGIRTADFLNDPVFQIEPLKSNPAKFFTFLILVKGAYAVFVATQTGHPIDYALLRQFARTIKPTYTDFFVVTDLDFIQDGLNFFIGPVDVTNAFDAASTLEFNCINFSVITTPPPGFLAINGFPDEATLAATGCGMDPDSLGLFEEFQIITGEEVLIDTLENNLVNFGTFGGPPPEEMDDDSIPFTESLQINDAIGTPPGSFIPPFTPGALVYTTP